MLYNIVVQGVVLNVYAACMKYYSLYLLDVADNVHEWHMVDK